MNVCVVVWATVIVPYVTLGEFLDGQRADELDVSNYKCCTQYIKTEPHTHTARTH